MLFNEGGFEAYLNVANTVGGNLSEDLNCGIIGDAIILRECFQSAKHSITFHGQGTSASHIKQAGHCCFWLSKLKPMKFSTGYAEFAMHLLNRRRSFYIEQNHSAIATAALPINEIFALNFGHKLAIDGLVALATNALADGDINLSEKIEAEIIYHCEKYPKILSRIAKSLRVNNHSARSVAAMFEWVYFNGVE